MIKRFSHPAAGAGRTYITEKHQAHMAGTFHWVKIRLFCYSTEDEIRLEELMTAIAGGNTFEKELTEGHHGNPMIIMESEITKDREIRPFFTGLGKELLSEILDDLDDKIDDDCVFYLRLDKQRAVGGEYRIAHHGDVISVTAKIVSHPARKEIAARNMRSFLEGLL